MATTTVQVAAGEGNQQPALLERLPPVVVALIRDCLREALAEEPNDENDHLNARLAGKARKP